MTTNLNQVSLALIASGSGTDANAIMTAHSRGQIPEVGNIVLISTKAEAGCLARAEALNYPRAVVEPEHNPLQTITHKRKFLDGLSIVVREHGCGLVFLVGCNVILPTDSSAFCSIWSVPIYNIHPADTWAHGGNHMHGLRVHEHVLAEALDLIRRGKKDRDRDRFFTYPTVHEVTAKVDDGSALLRGTVEIPNSLILRVLAEQITLTEAAQELQKAVLPYEWQMLPAAVGMAARRIMNPPR